MVLASRIRSSMSIHFGNAFSAISSQVVVLAVKMHYGSNAGNFEVNLNPNFSMYNSV